jgi:hypothetical protein
MSTTTPTSEAIEAAAIPAGHPDDDPTIRAGVWAVMREQGFTDGEILDAETTTCPGAGCEFDYKSLRWDHDNEDGGSNHPKVDRLQEVYETVRVSLEAMEPIIQAQAKAALDAVEKVCAAWTARGEHDMEFSKTVPLEDVADALLTNGADMVEKARIIRAAISAATLQEETR